jgi:hypothetical protein
MTPGSIPQSVFGCAMMAVMDDRRDIMERVGKVSESDRRFDVEFWQKQGSTAIFAAAWQMVVDAHRWKKKSDAELELQRSVEHVKPLRG